MINEDAPPIPAPERPRDKKVKKKRRINWLAVVLAAITSYFLSRVIEFYLEAPPPYPEMDLQKWWGPYNSDKESNRSIQPYTIEFPDVITNDLKERLLHRRPFTPPIGNTDKYGFNTDFLTLVLNFWQNGYNFKEREKFLNKYPQFVTNIQGLDIHYLHIKPAAASNIAVVPILLIHNWPSSIREFYEIIPILTTQQADNNIVFEVIVPSLPGFGFSEAPTREGMGVKEIAVILNNLMARIGHKEYYIQGGDFGQHVGSAMATLFQENVLGFHINMPVVVGHVSKRLSISLHDVINDAIGLVYCDEIDICSGKGPEPRPEVGRPDTYGIALTESPAGLAAYILEKFAIWTGLDTQGASDGDLLSKYSVTQLLDNVMIYWITNSFTTSLRIYNGLYTDMWLIDLITTNVPTKCIKFKHEPVIHDLCLRRKYLQMLPSTVVEYEGHYPAMQHPQLLADDIFSAVTVFRTTHGEEKISEALQKYRELEAKEPLEWEAKETLIPEAKKTLEPEAKETLDREAKKTLEPEAKENLEPEAKETLEPEAKKTVYDFKVKDINGNEISLEKYKGKVLIIVNVASQCGYTDTHYTQLNELYEKYAEKGLRILAFPCNQFAGQEPGTLNEILQFTQKRNVKFDVFEKIDVNGENTHPLWAFLKKVQSGTWGDFIKWNFSKFIIDRNGVPVERFGPNFNPLALEPYLEKYW